MLTKFFFQSDTVKLPSNLVSTIISPRHAFGISQPVRPQLCGERWCQHSNVHPFFGSDNVCRRSCLGRIPLHHRTPPACVERVPLSIFCDVYTSLVVACICNCNVPLSVICCLGSASDADGCDCVSICQDDRFVITCHRVLMYGHNRQRRLSLRFWSWRACVLHEYHRVAVLSREILGTLRQQSAPRDSLPGAKMWTAHSQATPPCFGGKPYSKRCFISPGSFSGVLLPAAARASDRE